jgi:hypothetical protein
MVPRPWPADDDTLLSEAPVAELRDSRHDLRNSEHHAKTPSSCVG